MRLVILNTAFNTSRSIMLRRCVQTLLVFGVAIHASASQPKPIPPVSPQATPAQAIPGGLGPQTLQITSIAPEPTTIVSERDGTAVVNFLVKGYGSDTCTLRMDADGAVGHTIVDTPITPQDGLPKTMSVKFAYPAKFVVNFSTFGCASKSAGALVKLVYTVQPHPDYPCSLYPGYKNDLSLGGPKSLVCTPSTPTPSNVDSRLFQCGNGRVYRNIGNYIFGCMPPGLFSY